MYVLVTGRQAGKTTRMMDWVRDGVKVSGYPGWSRIAVVVSERRRTDLKRRFWGTLDDFDHRVYTLQEMQTGRFTGHGRVYRLDDLDAFLPHFFPGLNIDGFTVTGSEWEETGQATCPYCGVWGTTMPDGRIEHACLELPYEVQQRAAMEKALNTGEALTAEELDMVNASYRGRRNDEKT